MLILRKLLQICDKYFCNAFFGARLGKSYWGAACVTLQAAGLLFQGAEDTLASYQPSTNQKEILVNRIRISLTLESNQRFWSQSRLPITFIPIIPPSLRALVEMRLINTKTLQLTEVFEKDAKPYAILSHTWGAEEVSFQEIQSGRPDTSKEGYRKIADSCRQAAKYGYEFNWVDTCCMLSRWLLYEMLMAIRHRQVK